MSFTPAVSSVISSFFQTYLPILPAFFSSRRAEPLRPDRLRPPVVACYSRSAQGRAFRSERASGQIMRMDGRSTNGRRRKPAKALPKVGSPDDARRCPDAVVGEWGHGEGISMDRRWQPPAPTIMVRGHHAPHHHHHPWRWRVRSAAAARRPHHTRAQGLAGGRGEQRCRYCRCREVL